MRKYIGMCLNYNDFVENEKCINCPSLYALDVVFPIDKSKMYAYNILDLKEDNKMSFVGLQLLPKKRKVIAFADSKSSLISRDGRLEENYEYPIANKLFATDKFIAVTWGANMLHPEFPSIIPIEKFFKDHAQDDIGVILEEMQELYGTSPGLFHTYFLFARKGSKFYEYADLGPEGITIKKHKVCDRDVVLGGDEYYCNLFEKYISLKNCSQEELKDKISKAIEYREQADKYNPVGFPLKIVEWDWGLVDANKETRQAPTCML